MLDCRQTIPFSSIEWEVYCPIAPGTDFERTHIYIPIGNLNISNKVTQIDPLPIKQGGLEVLNKLSTIASQLNLGSSNPTEQLSNLLGWVENKLNEDETRERLYYQGNKEELLTTAIESLTEQVKRASDIIESNINKNNLLPIEEIPSNIEAIPEQLPLPKNLGVFIDRDSNSPINSLFLRPPSFIGDLMPEELDPDTASEPVAPPPKNSTGDKLDPLDLNSTIEALNTSIALKQSAIAKEKKKRSKAVLDTIALWEKEIESIERSIDYLKKKDKRL